MVTKRALQAVQVLGGQGKSWLCRKNESINLLPLLGILHAWGGGSYRRRHNANCWVRQRPCPVPPSLIGYHATLQRESARRQVVNMPPKGGDRPYMPALPLRRESRTPRVMMPMTSSGTCYVSRPDPPASHKGPVQNRTGHAPVDARERSVPDASRHEVPRGVSHAKRAVTDVANTSWAALALTEGSRTDPPSRKYAKKPPTSRCLVRTSRGGRSWPGTEGHGASGSDMAAVPGDSPPPYTPPISLHSCCARVPTVRPLLDASAPSTCTPPTEGSYAGCVKSVTLNQTRTCPHVSKCTRKNGAVPWDFLARFLLQ